MNTQDNTELLIQAATRGDTAQVERLIPIANPKDDRSRALRCAAKHGHTPCVQLLIPVSDPRAKNSYAVQISAYYGHTDCVKLLIPLSDPRAKNSNALRIAAFHGHNDCVDLLFDVSDLDRVLEKLQEDLPDHPNTWQYLQEKITAQHQHALLTQETSYVSSTTKQRKM